MGDVPFIVLSGIVLFLNIAPLWWQAQHNNAAPTCLSIWVVLSLLLGFVSYLYHLRGPTNEAIGECDCVEE
jgi:hypothetical protein